MTATCVPEGTTTTPGGSGASLVLARLRLIPGTVLVQRTPRHLQVGLVRDRAVEVVCPQGLTPTALASLLSDLDGSEPLGAVLVAHGVSGEDEAHLLDVLVHLEAIGHLRRVTPDADATRRAGSDGAPHTRTVSLLGTGPMAHRLRSALALNGCVVESCSPPGCGIDPARPPWRVAGRDPDLVLLTDTVVPDPLLTRVLVEHAIPHLHVHCRDGRVVVGPTVVPGVTSCLRCASLHCAERDPLWPTVAAQLMSTTSTAPVATLAAGAALVLAEFAALRGVEGHPQTLGATVEISPGEGVWHRIPWPPHPRCTCGSAATPPTLP